MINVQFLAVAFIVSAFVDWVFQNQWQANNKSKWQKDDDKLVSLIAVLSHSAIYATLTISVTVIILPNILEYFSVALLVLFLSHAIIDTRMPVKWIMKLKGLTDEQIADGRTYGFLQIGIDQRLHEAVLLILACFFK